MGGRSQRRFLLVDSDPGGGSTDPRLFGGYDAQSASGGKLPPRRNMSEHARRLFPLNPHNLGSVENKINRMHESTSPGAHYVGGFPGGGLLGVITSGGSSSELRHTSL